MKMKTIIKTNAKSGIAKGVILGSILSIITTISCIAVFALLLANGSIGQNQANLLSYGSLIIGAAVGTIVSTSINNQKLLLSSVLPATTFYLLLLAITALFFNGRYEGMIANAVCIIIGTGIGITPKVMPKKRRGSRIKKMHYC